MRIVWEGWVAAGERRRTDKKNIMKSLRFRNADAIDRQHPCPHIPQVKILTEGGQGALCGAAGSVGRTMIRTWCGLVAAGGVVGALQIPAEGWLYSGHLYHPQDAALKIPYTDYVAVDVSFQHAMALKRDGGVVGWGAGNQPDLKVPPAARSGIMAISAGRAHSLALTKNGEVIAWGGNDFGECTVPEEARSGVTAVEAGGYHSLALKNGGVIAWGMTHHYNMIVVPPAAKSGVVAFTNGGDHTLALKEDGSVVAWGRNDNGQTNVPAEAMYGVTAVAASGLHSMALKEDGRVIAWGYGPLTELPEETQSDVISISAGFHHSAALKKGGRVVIWGHSSVAALDVPAEALSGVVSINAQDVNPMALKEDGTIVTWGADNPLRSLPAAFRPGITSISTNNSRTVIVRDGVVYENGGNIGTAPPPEAKSGVRSAQAGGLHVVALKEDGSVLAWGMNIKGETTIPVAARSGVKEIAASSLTSAALKEDGTVIVWGDSTVGQTSVPAAAQSGVEHISMTAAHVLALKQDGSVVAWGGNVSGQTTVPPEASSGVTAIATGWGHSVALKNGGVIAWGSNTMGQSTVPVAAQSGVTAISAYGDHTVALKADGNVVIWGDNSHGQDVVPALVRGRVGAVIATRGATFFKLKEPIGGYEDWTVSCGLAGNDAAPAASPHGDGLSNLLKYAFNLDGSRPDARGMTGPEGLAGLPRGKPFTTLPHPGLPDGLEMTYLRRKNSGLDYVVEFSGTLEPAGPGSWTSTTPTPPIVHPVNEEWERVSVMNPQGPGNPARGFGRVRVIRQVD